MNKEEKKKYEDATKDYLEEKEELYKKDILFLENLKKEISSKYFNYIKFEMENSENPHIYRFINKPIGKAQYEEEGDYTVFIDQYTGCCEDDYYGTVCMKISNNKYLIWDYYM